MEGIRQNMTGYRMPAYVEEILTQNYCSNFMRMSIVKDRNNYSFSYKPEGMSRLDPAGLRLYDKLILLRDLIAMCEDNADQLIDPENYLLEPELVYSNSGKVDTGRMKLMYYPDVKKLDFRYKIVIFANRIFNTSDREEREVAGRFREAAESGDINRIKLFLDKNILRMENRMAESATLRA